MCGKSGVFASLNMNPAFFRGMVKNRGFLGVKMGVYESEGIIYRGNMNVCIYECLNV